MTFIEAIKTKRPLTRKDRCWSYTIRTNNYFIGSPLRFQVTPNTFIDPDYFLENFSLTPQDILAEDWIVQGVFKQYDYETVE